MKAKLLTILSILLLNQQTFALDERVSESDMKICNYVHSLAMESYTQSFDGMNDLVKVYNENVEAVVKNKKQHIKKACINIKGLLTKSSSLRRIASDAEEQIYFAEQTCPKRFTNMIYNEGIAISKRMLLTQRLNVEILGFIDRECSRK